MSEGWSQTPATHSHTLVRTTDRQTEGTPGGQAAFFRPYVKAGDRILCVCVCVCVDNLLSCGVVYSDLD